MRRLVLLLVPACGFSLTATGSSDDVPGEDARTPDAPIARRCETGDPALRLCIDFDGETAGDGSPYALPVEAENLAPMTRDAESAVQLSALSRLYVPETPALDIAEHLTVALWIDVPLGELPLTGARWLYDNNAQYHAQLRAGGVVRCGSATVVLDGASITPDRWHHVACTYAPDEMRVYVDGAVVACRELDDRVLPTDGDDGMAIGANLSGGTGGVTFGEQLVGGVDNVQVFARTLESAELCTAAGRTGCADRCPAL